LRRSSLRDHAAVPVLGHVLSDQLAAAARAGVAWVTPLYQGVALTRALSLGTALDDPIAMLFHVLYLSTFAIVGGYLTIRLIERRLVRG
jgi:hypothetical protein